jgi:lipoprotein-releasing system ATP-binding protein
MADLVVDNVSKQYPTRAEPLVVLRGVSLELSAGRNLAIVGPSGSGKSTLLHVIGTLDEPTSGSVTLGGENPFALSEPQLARFRNRNVGFVFQDHHLLPQLSVLENVLIPTIADGSPNRDMVERAHRLLEQVGLENRLEHRPAELSGGERQRVAVARALIRNPRLLLADEPTGSLDRANAHAVSKLLLDLQQQENTMLIVVTHSVELANLLERRLQITDGALFENGSG